MISDLVFKTHLEDSIKLIDAEINKRAEYKQNNKNVHKCKLKSMKKIRAQANDALIIISNTISDGLLSMKANNEYVIFVKGIIDIFIDASDPINLEYDNFIFEQHGKPKVDANFDEDERLDLIEQLKEETDAPKKNIGVFLSNKKKPFETSKKNLMEYINKNNTKKKTVDAKFDDLLVNLFRLGITLETAHQYFKNLKDGFDLNKQPQLYVLITDYVKNLPWELHYRIFTEPK